MHAHKFGNYTEESDDEDNRIKILDDTLGKEILKKLEDTTKLEYKIIDELFKHKMNIAYKIKTLSNNYENIFPKQSHSIVFKDTLEIEFNSPAEYKNCEIALLDFQTDELLNINSFNNIFEYKDSDEDWKTLKIKEGCYTKDRLQSILDKRAPNKGKHTDKGVVNEGKAVTFEFTHNKVILRLLSGIKVRFTHPHSIGKLFGFEGEYSADSIPKRIESKQKVDLTFNNPITIHLNCVENNYVNNTESQIVYSFHYKGCKVSERPNTLIYHPIKDNSINFKVEIKDQDGEKIYMDKFYLNFHIKNDELYRTNVRHQR